MIRDRPRSEERERTHGDVVRGLDARSAARPAQELMSEIPWNGARLDPERTSAGVFLANL